MKAFLCAPWPLKYRRKAASLKQSVRVLRRVTPARKDSKTSVNLDAEVVVSTHTNEIDSLFASIKENKNMKLENDKKLKLEKQIEQKFNRSGDKARVSRGRSKSSIVSPDAPVERIDRASGYPVYKAHLLKVGEGGGTPQCPFDCVCCF